jgi:hypothetical protein
VQARYDFHSRHNQATYLQMDSAAPLDLNPLFNPRFIAVIGAFAQGGRATGAVRNLQELGFTGAIYPVNPKYESVSGSNVTQAWKPFPVRSTWSASASRASTWYQR